ncbi:MAG: PadR family transcriptional regulator [Deltaproteobacteria bacterium]|jgi:DNA-binding PadR family transcriptional regulator|nr:PadR family transcriptional regulator [Deltaproteobacteria bacterium]
MDFGDCPCTGKTLTKLVQPLIMALLARGRQHGYALKRALDKQDDLITQGAPDISGIYRTLKDMERQGYVESSWQLNSNGPATRCFTLTEDGFACLEKWRETLMGYKKQVNELINFIDSSLCFKSQEEEVRPDC